MAKFISILCLLAITSLQVSAQLNVNPGVDTTDLTIKAAVKFYSSYMSEFKGKKIPDFKKYWSEADCKHYKVPDPGVYGLGGDYPTYSMAPIKTITYVKPLPNDIIILKSIGGWIDTLKILNVTYLSTHYIKKDKNQQLHFISPIAYDQQNWQRKSLRNIHYIFPKKQVFNKKKADSLMLQIEKLEKDWGIKPIEIDYYFAPTYDEIQQIRGYDFTLGQGNREKPSGISNQTDNIVYCAGNGENYFHEIVHIYLNPIHSKSPLNEGLAVFYGGSMGKDLSWHVKRLKAYLDNHPQLSLNKPEDFYFMDNYTNPLSTIQGLLCHLIYQKDGIKGLKRLMAYTDMNEVYEKEFKLDLQNLNKGLRALLEKQ